VIGPRPGKAARFERPGPDGGQRRRPPKRRRLPASTPRSVDDASHPAAVLEHAFPKVTRAWRVQPLRDVPWWRVCQTDPVTGARERDPSGPGRAEAVVGGDRAATARFVILGDCRRSGGALAWFASQPAWGPHDPRAWNARGVERARPRAWFVGSPTLPWHAVAGPEGRQVVTDRPGHATKVTPTCTDRLGGLRLRRWESEVEGEPGDAPPSPEGIQRPLPKLAAVA
jgi:hypothetical protein